MRIGELSRRSGVPVSSIKLYLREQLLRSGERTAANQAEYTDEHLRRVRTIRALLHVGGLSIASARSVLEAIDGELPLGHAFGVAQAAASKAVPFALQPEDVARAERLIDDWCVHPGTPGRIGTAQALRALEDAGQDVDAAWLAAYRRAALEVAEADLDLVARRGTREQQAETVVIGTVLGDALFAGLRRAAQEHVTAVRYGAPDRPFPDPEES